MGVGRANISLRLLKNFNLVFLPELSNETLNYMITKIFDWGFSESPNNIK